MRWRDTSQKGGGETEIAALGGRQRLPQTGSVQSQTVHDAPPVTARGGQFTHSAPELAQQHPGADATGKSGQRGDQGT